MLHLSPFHLTFLFIIHSFPSIWLSFFFFLYILFHPCYYFPPISFSLFPNFFVCLHFQVYSFANLFSILSQSFSVSPTRFLSFSFFQTVSKNFFASLPLMSCADFLSLAFFFVPFFLFSYPLPPLDRSTMLFFETLLFLYYSIYFSHYKLFKSCSLHFHTSALFYSSVAPL